MAVNLTGRHTEGPRPFPCVARGEIVSIAFTFLASKSILLLPESCVKMLLVRVWIRQRRLIYNVALFIIFKKRLTYGLLLSYNRPQDSAG